MGAGRPARQPVNRECCSASLCKAGLWASEMDPHPQPGSLGTDSWTSWQKPNDDYFPLAYRHIFKSPCKMLSETLAHWVNISSPALPGSSNTTFASPISIVMAHSSVEEMVDK